jgi:alpha/beta superfamily hydrolase
MFAVGLFFLNIPTVFAQSADDKTFEAIRFLSVYDNLEIFDEENADAPHFFTTKNENVKGVVIIAHGLNVLPSKMGTPDSEGSLVKLFLDSGCHVFRVALSGHAGSINKMQTVSPSKWLADAYIQYCAAYIAADKQKLPLYLCAFSLGALVFEDLINEETTTPVRFEKAILFAPAIAINASARALLVLDPFMKDSAIINSMSPAEYRAQRGASLAAYKAVFELEKRIKNNNFANNNISTLVFIDGDDEFISMGGIKNHIKRFNLSAWNVFQVSNAGARINPQYHHLIIDNRCVSAETWQAITNNILKTLETEQ